MFQPPSPKSEACGCDRWRWWWKGPEEELPPASQKDLKRKFNYNKATFSRPLNNCLELHNPLWEGQQHLCSAMLKVDVCGTVRQNVLISADKGRITVIPYRYQHKESAGPQFYYILTLSTTAGGTQIQHYKYKVMGNKTSVCGAHRIHKSSF